MRIDAADRLVLDTFLPSVERLADVILVAGDCLDEPDELGEADALEIAYEVRPLVLEKVVKTLEEG